MPQDLQTASASFLDDLDIRHGPRQLLGRFFVNAVAAVAKRDVTLSFGTFSELVEFNRQNQTYWFPLTTAFTPELGGFDDDDGFVIIGRNGAGDVVATQAMRLYDWRATNFKQEAESLRLFYGQPERDKQPSESCAVTAETADDLKGLVALGGAIWYRPDYRGKDLPSIIPRLARAYAYALWNVDYITALIAEENVARGFARRLGYRDISSSVLLHHCPCLPDGDFLLGLARMSQTELIDDVFGFLMQQVDTQVDIAVEQRRAQ